MLRIWDSHNLSVSATFARQQYFQTCCSCSDDGNRVLSGTNGFDGSGCLVSLWDIRTNEKIWDMQGASVSCDFNLLFCNIGSVRSSVETLFFHFRLFSMWDVIRTSRSQSTSQRWVAITSCVFGGGECKPTGHNQRVTSCTFVRMGDAQLMCTCSMDGSLRLWDEMTGTCVSLCSFQDVKFTSLAPVTGPGGVTK
jgi:WD40 repeat protein